MSEAITTSSHPPASEVAQLLLRAPAQAAVAVASNLDTVSPNQLVLLEKRGPSPTVIDLRLPTDINYQKPSESDQKGLKQWRVDPTIAGGGYFFDLGSHMIDLLQYLLGPIGAAVGFSSNQGKLYAAEDIVSAAFTFENGAHGVGLWSFSADENLDSTEIIGSRGKISYSTFLELPITLERDGSVQRFDIPHPEHVQQPLIQNIVDELLGIGESPSTGKTGAMTNWVMDKMLRRV